MRLVKKNWVNCECPNFHSGPSLHEGYLVLGRAKGSVQINMALIG